MNIPYNYIKILKNFPSAGQAGSGKPPPPPKKKTVEAGNKVEEAGDAANKTSKSFNTLSEKIDALTDNFDTLFNKIDKSSLGLSKYVAVQEQLGSTLNKVTAASTFLEKRNIGLTKTFKINSVSAAGLGDRYDKIATTIGTGGKQIRKYAQELNTLLPLQAANITKNDQATGTMNKFGKQLLTTGKYFRENFGMDAESVQGFARFAASANDGAMGTEDILAQTVGYVAELEKVTGLVGTTEAILSGISKLSADVQLNFRRFPTDLGIAVLKARMLGTSLGEVYNIGKNLLNIEQSVGNELEYQLLSGKRLVNAQGESLTQKFREATLSGNASDSADALNEILESQGDTIKDNFFARKQLAETLGIGEDKLANMLQQRELLEQAGSGAEAILELSGDKLLTGIENYEINGKEASKEQKDALKELVKVRANALSTEDRQILAIEANTTALISRQVKAMGVTAGISGSAGIVGQTQQVLTDPELISSQLKLAETINGLTEETIVTKLDTLAKTGLATQATVDNTTAIYAMIPGIEKAVEYAGGLLLAGVKNINNLTPTTTETLSTTPPVATEVVNDFISRPGGPVQSFSSADTVIGAKTGGPIDQMLASSGNTSGAGIDYNAMANAIASAGGGGGTSIDYGKMAQAIAGAIKNIQIVAPTDIYKDSSMNMGSLT